jgi:ketosteroid isomerase-like protein
MSVQDTEATISAYLSALMSGSDFGSYFAEDVLWTTMENGDQVRGRREVTDYIVALHTQVFAASPELVNVAYGDGFAILEAVFVGTHIGEFGDIPATGVKVRLPYCVAYTIADSKITELRAYLSMLALQQHLTGGATGTPDH